MSATHFVEMVDAAGRVLATRTGVRTDEVPSTVLTLLRQHGWQGCRIVVDGQQVLETAPGREGRRSPVAEDGRAEPGLAGEWKFVLTDDHVLHRLPLVNEGAGDPTLRGGPGPGPLVWQPIEEHGMRGLAAPWQRGTFKILRVGSGHCGLFYERAAGDWETLAMGAPDALKERARVRTSAATCAPPLPDFMAQAIREAAPWRRRRGGLR